MSNTRFKTHADANTVRNRIFASPICANRNVFQIQRADDVVVIIVDHNSGLSVTASQQVNDSQLKTVSDQHTDIVGNCRNHIIVSADNDFAQIPVTCVFNPQSDTVCLSRNDIVSEI